jgi:hypothetical protein
LGGGDRVVQQYADAPVVREGAQQRDTLGQRGRHVLRRDAERAEEPAEDVLGAGRPLLGVAAEVGVQLAVREVVIVRLGPRGGQRGLADAGGAGDDQERAGAAGAGMSPLMVEPLVVFAPTREQCRDRGQLPWRTDARRVTTVEVRLLDPSELHDGSGHPTGEFVT